VGLIRDLSLNGKGVNLNSMPEAGAVDLSSTDFTVNHGNVIAVGGAGNVILRAPGSNADYTVAAIAGQSIPIASGSVVRKTGTTATGLTYSSL
jgi:hypothetical protein